MKIFLKITFILSVSALFLGACSSNQAVSEQKNKTDLYLLNRMQENTMGIYEASETKSMELRETYFTTPSNNEVVKNRLKELMEKGEQFDEAFLKLIHQVETAKLEIAKQTIPDLNAKGQIAYEPKSMVSRYQFIDSDPNKSISLSFDFVKLGKEQYEGMLEFRKNVLSMMLDNTRDRNDKSFTFNDPDIRLENAGSKDVFYQSVEKSFTQMGINPDDAEISKIIYIMATPDISFYNEVFKEDISWIEKFRLLEDQKQLLFDIRRLFYSHIGSKVSLAKMVDFNSIIAVSEGNEYVEGGSEQNFNVYLAGINVNEQPVLTVNGINSSVNIQNGVAKVKVIIPKAGSECVYAGTISIRDKTGQIVERKWTKKFILKK